MSAENRKRPPLGTLLLLLLAVVMPHVERAAAAAYSKYVNVGLLLTLRTSYPATDYRADKNVAIQSAQTSGQPAGLAFTVALDEINSRSDILATTGLGHMMNDTMQIPEEAFTLSYNQRRAVNAVAWIGEADSDFALPTAFLSTIFSQAQISFAATAATFGDVTQYPNFFRTIGNIVRQTEVLARSLSALGWNRFAYAATVDALSLSASSAFSSNATRLGMTLVSSQVLSPGQTDTDYQFGLIKKARAHIIALFCTTSAAAQLMRFAIGAGLSGPTYMWVSTWDLMTSNVWTDTAGNIDWQIYNFSQNMLGVLPHVDYTAPTYIKFAFTYFNFRAVPEFPVPFRSQPPTRAVLAYDATYTLAWAADFVIEKSSPPLSTLQVNTQWRTMARNILTRIRASNFIGATGQVQFDAFGSRIMPYNLVQMQDGVFVPVAIASPPAMAVQFYSSDPINRGVRFPDNIKLRDDDAPIMLTAGSGLMSICLVLFILGWVLVIWIWALLALHAKRPAVAVLGPKFLRIILVGIVCGLAGLVFSPMDLGNVSPATFEISCLGNLWCLDVSFVLIVGALMAKSRKVAFLFAKQGLHTEKLADKNLLRMIALMLAGDCIILGVWSGTNPVTAAYLVDVTPVTWRPVCSSDNLTVFVAVSFAYKALLLVRAMMYNFRSRTAPTPDARVINTALWIVCLCAVIAVAAANTTGVGQLDNFNTLKLLGILLGTFGTLFTVFGPFLYACVFDEALLDEVPDTNVEQKSSGLPNSVQDVLNVRSRSRLFTRKCYFSEKKAKTLTSLTLACIMLAYAALSVDRMLTAYSSPSIITTQTPMPAFSVPGLLLCSASNGTSTAFNGQPLTLYGDPRYSFATYIDPANPSFPGLRMDCCVSTGSDLFTECYAAGLTCPVPARFRPSIAGAYAGWSVSFDCFDISPGLQITDASQYLYIPYYAYTDFGLLSTGSNSTDPSVDPQYLQFCSDFMFWPHKMVLISYVPQENQTSPISLIFGGAVDDKVGGVRGRWRIDVARGVASISVSQFSYFDMDDKLVPTQSGYVVLYNLDVPPISWGSTPSRFNEKRKLLTEFSWLQISFSLSLARIQPTIIFTYYDLFTCLLAIISAVPVIMNFFVGQGDYDPTGLINKLCFFDVPTLKGTASSRVLDAAKKNGKNKSKRGAANSSSADVSDDDDEDEDDDDESVYSESDSHRGSDAGMVSSASGSAIELGAIRTHK